MFKLTDVALEAQRIAEFEEEGYPSDNPDVEKLTSSVSSDIYHGYHILHDFSDDRIEYYVTTILADEEQREMVLEALAIATLFDMERLACGFVS